MVIGGDGWFTEISEGDRRIIMYPCENNSLMNFVAFVPNEATNVTDPDWHQRDNNYAVFKAFKSFFPAARWLLLYLPNELRTWHLYDMKTMSTWTKGRLALIGDAAHPFLPCKRACLPLRAWSDMS